MEKESPDERRGRRKLTEVQKLVGRKLGELLEDAQAVRWGVNLKSPLPRCRAWLWLACLCTAAAEILCV